MNSQKGISTILILLVGALVVGVGVYFFLGKAGDGDKMMEKETKVLIKQTEEESEPNEAFGSLSEDSDTPEEINNDVVDELDELILSIEGNEDLSDLDL